MTDQPKTIANSHRQSRILNMGHGAIVGVAIISAFGGSEAAIWFGAMIGSWLAALIE